MLPTLISSIVALPASNLSMLLLLAKATLILVAALGITLAMQRASAGARHLVWLVTLGTLLFVPALATWAPIRFAVLPSRPASSVKAPAINAALSNATLNSGKSEPSPSASIAAAAPVASDDNLAATTANSGVLARVRAMNAFSIMLAIWAAIVLIIAGWLAYGALAVRGIVRRARPLDGKEWLAPLWEVSDRLSLDETPRLLRSEDAKMPFACGIVHPTIVLPAECDNWTADRRLAVLLHELAHVRRHDLIGHTLGRLACAFYWFHPLVWTAAKHLRAESERACDDLALACGARASDYAEHLLDIVTSVRHDSTPAVALAMARRKEFEGRMLAILDPELRHSSPSRSQSAGLIGSLALIAIVVGAAAPSERLDRSAALAASPVDHVGKTAEPQPQLAKHPDKQYPDSGVPGVGSLVQRMVASTNQVTHTLMDTRVETRTVFDTKSNARGRADDRPVLLANVLRSDTSAYLRRIAAWGLSEYAESHVASNALAAALRKDSDASVREMAAWALGHGDDGNNEAIEALAAALRGDSNEKVRATAAWALGDLGDEGGMDALAAALSDGSPGIRMRAVWAIGQIGPKQAPRALVAMLQDRDPRVREITAWALYEIEDPGAVPALDAALRVEADKNLQVAYIRALAATGEKSVDAVRRLLESKDTQIRAMAVRALAGGNAAGPWPWPWPEPRPYP